MKYFTLVFAVLFLSTIVFGSPYVVEGDYGTVEDNLLHIDKRSCIRRSSSCDHRPNDCCFSSACRCNLWGTNCRCQRAGLFQRWGRK
ncbi:putative neurotoxin [Parasteatoda tepidariorum]|uniref:putative neurotoxin n=1 Tax=Parasteatoda tepidariorum TaxID=114398 RepID=UPI00077FC2AC|nr:U8-agatoxin-Ao1a-like [Parasteatoda tepidariorum]